jgi:hypothetical protein
MHRVGNLRRPRAPQEGHCVKGIAWALQDMARPLARKQGFDTLVSSIVTTDPVSSANALNWGLKITEAIVAFPLGESEHGRQRSK